MPYDFVLRTKIPATPGDIYGAWMSTEGHTAMTGTVSRVDPTIGGPFTAFDGYISGTTLELEPGRRIKQTWRTLFFSDDDADSTIEVLLEQVGDHTVLTLSHQNVPDGQTDYELIGWPEKYFEPMKRRFGWLNQRATFS